MGPEAPRNESQHGSLNWMDLIPEGERTGIVVDDITILLENWREI